MTVYSLGSMMIAFDLFQKVGKSYDVSFFMRVHIIFIIQLQFHALIFLLQISPVTTVLSQL